MPEAFSEAGELLAEIKRLRPQWMDPKGNRGISQRFKRDWRRAKAGFWERARHDPDREAKFIDQLGGSTLDAARQQAYFWRRLFHAFSEPKLFIDSNWNPNTPLTNVTGQLLGRPPGYDGDRVQAWRVSAWSSMTTALADPEHPYVEWLSGEVDFREVGRDPASWLRFWFYDVQSYRMPRFWLRWAFEHLQLFHNVTDGTPGDAQLATYLLESDVVVSADKNFIRITEAVRPYAEVPIAKTKRVSADKDGVVETLEFLQAKPASLS